MSNTLTVRLPEELAHWLEETSRKTATGPLHPQGIFAEVKAIADTGFRVAFGNRRDSHHRWALEIVPQISEPLLTCDAVRAGGSGSARL